MKTLTLGLLGAALVASLAAGCGDDDDDNALVGAGGAAGGAGQGVGSVTVLTRFDAGAGELPEGLALAADGTPYVGFAPKGEIARLSADGSARTPVAKVPAPPPDGTGFMTGLALDASNNLYAALVSFAPKGPAGVYRAAPSRGGEGGVIAADAPWAANEAMNFPNGIGIDNKAQFGYVTDSAAGAIFRFGLATAGPAEPWTTAPSDLLKGDPTACGGQAADRTIGANGLVIAGNTFFVANTNKGTVVRVPRNDDGTAGAPEPFVADCALKGIDGLAPDGVGGLYAAINAQNKVVRIGRDGAVTLVAQGGELDFPASLAAQGNSLYVTNFAFTSAPADKRPALLRIEIQSPR